MIENQIEISCFIPSYNEEKIIAECIDSVVCVLKKLNENFELLIVDDASNDSTENIVTEKISKDRRIKYIKHTTGPSERENLAQSFKLAKGNIIIFTDADLEADIKYIPRLVEAVKNGSDIAIGSRYVRGSVVKRTFLRLFYSVIFNWLIRKHFHSGIQDHHCGLKGFKKSALLPLVDKMGYDPYFIRGLTWDTELLIRAKKKGLKVSEIPVSWHYHKGRRFLNPYKQLKSFFYLLRIKKTI